VHRYQLFLQCCADQLLLLVSLLLLAVALLAMNKKIAMLLGLLHF
jgi:hypothetical protein